MSTHADAAVATLKAAVEQDYGAVRVTAQDFGRHISDLRGSSDLTDTMRAAAAAVLAAEALSAAATQIGASARAALAITMSSTGCPAIDLQSHRVCLAAKAPRAIVVDKDALPARYWIQPEPRPDLAALGKALRGGEQVTGAELTNDREPILVFRSKVS